MNKWIRWFAGITILTIAWWCAEILLLSSPPPTRPSPPVRTRSRHLPAKKPYTMAEKKAFADWLFDSLDHAVLHYPILPIRQRLAEFMAKANKPNHLVMVLDGPPDVFAKIGVDPKTPHLFKLSIHGQEAMDMLEDIGDDESFIDECIGSILHEAYHLKHHFPPVKSKGQCESEAWHDTVMTVFLPMQEHGRLKIAGPTATKAIAICKNNPNPQSQEWKTFITRLVGSPPD